VLADVFIDFLSPFRQMPVTGSDVPLLSEYYHRKEGGKKKKKKTHSRSGALLEKLPIVQPLNNFLVFYGTRSFITAFTRALHRSLS
jgi:hypothetical protein